MNTRLLLLFLIISNSLLGQCISGDCDDGEGTYIYQDLRSLNLNTPITKNTTQKIKDSSAKYLKLGKSFN